jgi:hypothetical protein
MRCRVIIFLCVYVLHLLLNEVTDFRVRRCDTADSCYTEHRHYSRTDVLTSATLTPFMLHGDRPLNSLRLTEVSFTR